MTLTAPQSSQKQRLRKLAVAIVAIVLLVIGGLVAWNNGVRDRLFPKNFGVVEPGQLYRSGQISRWQIERTLKNNGIKVIVALSAHASARLQPDIDAELATASALGIDREVFPLGGDGTGQ